MRTPNDSIPAPERRVIWRSLLPAIWWQTNRRRQAQILAYWVCVPPVSLARLPKASIWGANLREWWQWLNETMMRRFPGQRFGLVKDFANEKFGQRRLIMLIIWNESNPSSSDFAFLKASAEANLLFVFISKVTKVRADFWAPHWARFVLELAKGLER